MGIAALYTWVKWTVQSWFLARLTMPDRPGDDEQFALWNDESIERGLADVEEGKVQRLDWLTEDEGSQ